MSVAKLRPIKVISHANQKGHAQSNEPIKLAADTRRRKTCVGCARASDDWFRFYLGFTSDWMKKKQ